MARMNRMPRNLLVVGHATRARHGLAGFEPGCIYVGLLMVDRYSQPARTPPSRSCSSNPFQAMYARKCSRPSSCTAESLPSSAPRVPSQSSGVVPHGLPLSSCPDTPLTPYVRIRTVSNIHQHSSGLCDVGATLITTLYSHDMLLHVLKPRGALGKPISPSFAETYLALGTPTEVASNYGQAYSQEQNND